jgi:thymidylate kinase
MTATVLATLMMMAVLGTRSAPVSQSSAAASDPPQHVTHKLAIQVDNAVTRDDHRELAQRFRQEAQRNRQKEQYYLEMSANYRRHPLRIDAVQNVSTADRYLHWADEARDAARADDQMAILQDKLADGFVQAK